MDLRQRRYLLTHEWHALEGDICTIGITEIATQELTDITYVKLPTIGDAITAGKPLGEVESVKATSDLYSGVSGTVTAVNTALNDNPGMINADPYEQGWMIKVRVTSPAEYNQLLSYDDYVAKSKH